MMAPTKNSTPESLIVDFPPRRPSKKEVGFSSTSQMVLISYPTPKDIEESWYTSEDRKHFKCIVARDVHRYSRILFSKSELGLRLSEDERAHCIGLEHLLSRDINQNIAQINQRRKKHVVRVLEEQARQQTMGLNSADKLKCVSMKSSHKSRLRAHVLASASMDQIS